jgi:hypothetical protein
MCIYATINIPKEHKTVVANPPKQELVNEQPKKTFLHNTSQEQTQPIKKEPVYEEYKPKTCRYNGHTLIVGRRGGCYYINSNGNKTYVDRSYCSGCY